MTDTLSVEEANVKRIQSGVGREEIMEVPPNWGD